MTFFFNNICLALYLTVCMHVLYFKLNSIHYHSALRWRGYNFNLCHSFIFIFTPPPLCKLLTVFSGQWGLWTCVPAAQLACFLLAAAPEHHRLHRTHPRECPSTCCCSGCCRKDQEMTDSAVYVDIFHMIHTSGGKTWPHTWKHTWTVLHTHAYSVVPLKLKWSITSLWLINVNSSLFHLNVLILSNRYTDNSLQLL